MQSVFSCALWCLFFLHIWIEFNIFIQLCEDRISLAACLPCLIIRVYVWARDKRLNWQSDSWFTVLPPPPSFIWLSCHQSHISVLASVCLTLNDKYVSPSQDSLPIMHSQRCLLERSIWIKRMAFNFRQPCLILPVLRVKLKTKQQWWKEEIIPTVKSISLLFVSLFPRLFFYKRPTSLLCCTVRRQHDYWRLWGRSYMTSYFTFFF